MRQPCAAITGTASVGHVYGKPRCPLVCGRFCVFGYFQGKMPGLVDFYGPAPSPAWHADRRFNMAEIKRNRRNTLERRCLGKAFKRLFVNSPKGVFKMLEKVKRA